VLAIQSGSSNEQDLKQLKTTLLKEEVVFSKNLNLLDDVLAALDPSAHSLGYVVILATKASSQKLDGAKFLNQTQRFLNQCSSNQIRLLPTKFTSVARKFTELCIESGNALRAVKPIRSALKKSRASSECLTPLHADLLQVCLLSKCYSVARPILAEEVFDVTPESTAVTPKDYLLYYYYGGMIFTGLKDYKQALTFFRMVVTAPAVVLSAIMVEAYKKYILLSLLVHGKVSALPRYTSSVVQRYHKTAFPQYHEFSTAYGTHSTEDLHKVAETHAEIFQKDKNFGLIKQCIQSLYRRNIQRFTQTYLTFSLEDIAKSVNLASAKDAETQVLKMISNGEIFASINQKDGMVSFSEDPEGYDTSKMTSHLDVQIQKAIDLGRKVRSLDESIASSGPYIQKTTAQERGGGGRWGADFEDFVAEGAEKPLLFGNKMH